VCHDVIRSTAGVSIVMLGRLPHALEPPSMPRPNAILVSLDTLRFDALSAAPDRRLLGEDAALACTPTLDRIAREGTFFARAVTTFPYTSPSHASIFTGTHWPRHGILRLSGDRLSDEVEPIAEALQRTGYATAQNAGRGRRRGGIFRTPSMGLCRGYDSQAFGGWIHRQTWKWLRRTVGTAPWYLFFHTMSIHRPYGGPMWRMRAAARRDVARDEPFRRVRRLYLRNLTRVDRRLGRLWKRLRGMGALDNTLVVILGDHGEGLSVHGLQHGDVTGWQEGICRVPLIFWTPGLVKAGQVIEDPVSLVDVAPTVADLLQIDWHPPGGFDGVSLASTVRGGTAVEERPCFFFAAPLRRDEEGLTMQGVVKGTLKYVTFAGVPEEKWARIRARAERRRGDARRNWRHYGWRRLLESHAKGQVDFLFDIATDPEELHNLAGERPDVLGEFRQELTRWHEERGNPVPTAGTVAMSEDEKRDLQKDLRALGYMD
jgi:arylsulfatase A-like enzyme